MKQAAALHTHAQVRGVSDVRILKVLTPAEIAAGCFAPGACLAWNHTVAGSAGSWWADGAGHDSAGVQVSSPRDPLAVQPGDVVRLRPGGSQVSVLYRRGSSANTLFVTEQCSSMCVMCSQPPRIDDDSWRLAELDQLIRLVDPDEAQLGFTGGEPTLFREGLASLLNAARDRLPSTHLHVLTNGRSFADRRVADSLVAAGGGQTTWAIPLYGDTAALHDEVVGAAGAFEETLAGLHHLAARGARVEIRVVLQALTVSRLPQLAAYIYRRMPFVEHVALMGIEPMGFAKTNRDRVWIDPADYMPVLAAATHYLAARGLPTSIYNLPLCVLPADLHPYARASISDWKNRDAPECRSCVKVERCSGFFASAGPQWRSRAVKPFMPEMETAG